MDERKEILKLSILLEREGSWWIARALEHEFIGQGQDVDDALDSLLGAIVAQFAWDQEKGRKPFATIPQAGQSYLDRFSAARQRARKTLDGDRYAAGAPRFDSELAICA